MFFFVKLFAEASWLRDVDVVLAHDIELTLFSSSGAPRDFNSARVLAVKFIAGDARERETYEPEGRKRVVEILQQQ